MEDHDNKNYEEVLNEVIDYFSDMPKTIRLYYEHMLAMYKKKIMDHLVLPNKEGINLMWKIENYDQSEDEFGEWNCMIGLAKNDYGMYVDVSINIDNYPKEPPIITIKVNPDPNYNDVSSANDMLSYAKDKLEFFNDDGTIKEDFELYQDWDEHRYPLTHILNEISEKIRNNMGV